MRLKHLFYEQRLRVTAQILCNQDNSSFLDEVSSAIFVNYLASAARISNNRVALVHLRAVDGGNITVAAIDKNHTFNLIEGSSLRHRGHEYGERHEASDHR